MVKDVGEAFGEEAEVGRLPPDEEVEGDVKEFEAVVGRGVIVGAVGDVDGGFDKEVGAPGGVVTEEFGTEGAEEGSVEGFLGRGEAHLGIGEVENEVLALVSDVVVLEAKEEAKPVQEVHIRVPLRGEAKVADRAKGGDGGTDLREAERRVVDGRGVEGEDVVWVVGIVVVVVLMSVRHVMVKNEDLQQLTTHTLSLLRQCHG